MNQYLIGCILKVINCQLKSTVLSNRNITILPGHKHFLQGCRTHEGGTLSGARHEKYSNVDEGRK
jgi:hypothetical protein